MTIGEKLSTRGNSITLLRLAFALSVVFGHSYYEGGFGLDPIQRLGSRFGPGSFGSLGVNAFFAMSGFLVTKSWLASANARQFFWKRCLRLFPGFWVCLLVTGLVLFPALWAREHGTAWSAAYPRAPFVGYVWHNSALVMLQKGIGDLFHNQPVPDAVNGSLWSLFPEFGCYLAVAAGGLLGLLRSPRTAGVWIVAVALFALRAAGPDHLQAHLGESLRMYGWRVIDQATFFAVGALCCIYSQKLRVRTIYAAGAAAALVLATAAGCYFPVAPLLLPFLLLQLSCVLPGAWMDRAGDYSYGVYVYHVPVMHTLLAFGLSGGSSLSLFARTTACVLPPAILSWHLIEQPALRFKKLGRAKAPVAPTQVVARVQA